MDKAAPKIGVVTVTFNSADVIPDFMTSLLGQTFANFHLYAIDNASSDASVEKLRAISDPRVSIIANSDNVGVAAGNNQGIVAAINDQCSHVLLINNDTCFDASLLQGLLSDLAASNAAMIVPKIMFFDPPNMIWCAGGYFSRMRAYATIHTGEGETDRGQRDVAGLVDYTPTCCMLICKDVFNTIGLMDEKYFVYFDDSDFCLRAKRAGLRLWYTPLRKLYHKVGSLTGGKRSDFGARYGTRNKVYFLRKNFPAPVSTLFIFGYFVYTLAQFVAGRDSLRMTRLRQRAFMEGFRL